MLEALAFEDCVSRGDSNIDASFRGGQMHEEMAFAYRLYSPIRDPTVWIRPLAWSGCHVTLMAGYLTFSP